MIISPMWDDEVERIGMRDCTPAGYVLRSLADLAGILASAGMIAGIAAIFILGKMAMAVCWIAGVSMLVIAVVLRGISWWLVRRGRFHYDADARRATWIRRGQRHTLTLEDIRPRLNEQFRGG